MKSALITGIAGQDGSYLAELLLEKGYVVHGLIRRASSFNTQRIDHLFQDPHESNLSLHLHYGDITDGAGLTNLINQIQPDEIYHLAAQSHVKISFSMPHYTASVDAIGTITILEAIRSSKLDTKFYQASTSELFGATPPHKTSQVSFIQEVPMQLQNSMDIGQRLIIEKHTDYLQATEYCLIMNLPEEERHL